VISGTFCAARFVVWLFEDAAAVCLLLKANAAEVRAALAAWVGIVKGECGV
jgi:hypothetical protein